jgi:TM2 domain-containing membrane protein YozV
VLCTLLSSKKTEVVARKIIFILLVVLCASTAHAQRELPGWKTSVFFEKTGDNTYEARGWWYKEGRENTRLVAIVLDITLGLFGAHRMYLGTDVRVPVFYTLTAGGGVVLWLIDLGLLLSTKDLKPFTNNPHIFMWVNEETAP